MRQVLLGKAPLGQGQGGGVGHQADFAAPPYFLLRDTFTSAVPAGSVDGSAAEPGPGVRTVTDSNNKLRITGEVLNFSTGGAGNSDPSLYYAPIALQVGRALLATVVVSGGTFSVGWDVTSAIPLSYAFRWQTSGGLLAIRNNAANVFVGVFTTGQTHQVAIIVGEAGSALFIRGGDFTHWTLIYDAVGAFHSLMSPAIGVESTIAVATVDNMRIPAARWYPEPLVSDGFTIADESDGLGHAEGVASAPYGQGGDGVSWTDTVGTWVVADGAVAATALVGSIGIRTIDSGVTDVMVTASIYQVSGLVGVIVAYVDSANYVYAYHNGTNAVLAKRVANTITTLVTQASTDVAGAPLRVSRAGQAYRFYHNNVFLGTEQTISDAVFDDVTVQGLYTNGLDNDIDDFVVYARGSGGEYNTALDALAGL